LHVSLPLHALPSEHAVPADTGVCVTPVAGSHASAVHGLLSSTLIGPGTHAALASHVAPHFEHDVPTATGVCVTPVAALHASTVQGFPSSSAGATPAWQCVAPSQVSRPLHALPSEHEAPAAVAVCTTPVAGSHESTVQGIPSSTAGAVPAWHAPVALQISLPLHALPSEHAVPAAAGVWVTPVAGLHASTVHGFPSSTVGAVPAWHAPVPLQVSVPLHAFPSEHDVPADAGGFEHAPDAGSHVPATWHGSLAAHAIGLAPVHAPAWQVSAWVQALPSSHALPLALAGLEHAPVDVLHVPATWH
jgi:hypothetical protein